MTLEEIQNWIADHENRISFLENSLPGSAMSYQPQEKEPVIDIPMVEPKWLSKLQYQIEQLKGQVLHLQKKVVELSTSQRGRVRGPY